MTPGPHEVVLLAGMFAAGVIDARTGKIPNALNGLLMALGLVWWTVEGVPLVGVLGLASAFALHFLLWRLGVEKAGDAKLFMGLGATLGWQKMLEASLWTGVVYLPVGLMVLAMQGKLPQFIEGMRYVAQKAQGLDPGEPPEPTMLRTGPIIAVGGAIAVFVDLWPG